MANQKPSTIKPTATKKTKIGRSRAQECEGFDRFGILLEESQKFCEGVSLHKDLIVDILRTDSDWAFMLKVDALLESASKEILRQGLRIKLLNRSHTQRDVGGFRRLLADERAHVASEIAGRCRAASRGAWLC